MGKAIKKQSILNLIKYHVEKRDNDFKNESVTIARYFDSIGDYQLSEYIMSLIAESSLYTTQDIDSDILFLTRLNLDNLPTLTLPSAISRDLEGLINSINRRSGLNKFMFEGKSGTGKTEAAKYIANMLGRELYYVNFESIIDSKLGQTNKNIVRLFSEIRHVSEYVCQNIVVLFDEIDSIVLDRINSNDVREMGRATSMMLRELDKLTSNKYAPVIIATTNLMPNVDKALLRRFDAVINFDRYTHDDLVQVAERFVNDFAKEYKGVSKDTRLLRKILTSSHDLPSPGEMRNVVRTSLAFSDTSDGYDYLRRLYCQLVDNIGRVSCDQLHAQGFTMREIESLKGESRSTVSRKLSKKVKHE